VRHRNKSQQQCDTKSFIAFGIGSRFYPARTFLPADDHNVNKQRRWTLTATTIFVSADYF